MRFVPAVGAVVAAVVASAVVDTAEAEEVREAFERGPFEEDSQDIVEVQAVGEGQWQVEEVLRLARRLGLGLLGRRGS